MPTTVERDDVTRQDAVTLAAWQIPAEVFHGTDGNAVRPCTPARVTHRHLRLLEVRPGHHVLDIGVGSGYSAALLNHIAGPTGHVVAIEINPDLALRAKTLFAEHGIGVDVAVGDGHLGRPTGAPYDRILVGATPHAIPHTWLEQLRPGATLLTGVRLGDLPGCYAIATITIDEDHQPARITVHHGGYTPMTEPQPVPTDDTARGDTHTARLLNHRHVELTPAPQDDYPHLKNWLIATCPENLLVATLPEGAGIGIATPSPDRPANVAIITENYLIADHPHSPAITRLRAHLDQWRAAGSPRTHHLPCRLNRHDRGWQPELLPP
jgi:protein-L-isoaspartate(D-aspartate) O-methyltransferase